MNRLPHEGRLALLALLAATPATAWAVWRLLAEEGPPDRWIVAGVLVAFAVAVSLVVRERAAWPLRTLANLLGGLREGDFSMRLRGGTRRDALGEAILEANALAAELRDQRLAALEATSLLRAVMSEIDVAILVFDPARRLKLANRAAERLLAAPVERLTGAGAGDLGLADCLEGEPARTVEREFPGGAGRWGVRRATVREGGLPHELLVVANLSTALREEERLAWRRLIRVLGHELNNSLAPIKSIAGSLTRRIGGAELGPEARDDLARGLQVIADRAESLTRFMEGYSRLARLPAPRPRAVAVGAAVATAAALEKRLPIAVVGGPEVEVEADPDQLQQVLINLLANAAEASSDAGEPIRIDWSADDERVTIRIADRGTGLANPSNLFVPFFTTKPGGSGIGLALCRQIADAHGGDLALRNRDDGAGCLAELTLPLHGPAGAERPAPVQ